MGPVLGAPSARKGWGTRLVGTVVIPTHSANYAERMGHPDLFQNSRFPTGMTTQKSNGNGSLAFVVPTHSANDAERMGHPAVVIDSE